MTDPPPRLTPNTRMFSQPIHGVRSRPTIATIIFAAWVIPSMVSPSHTTRADEPVKIDAKMCASSSEVWLVNSRCAPSCGDLDAGFSQIRYWRLDESSSCGKWQPSDAVAFQIAGRPGVPTTVLLHGNLTDDDWAVQHGNEIYASMKRQSCGGAFRLVVWSWPADRIARRPRADVQLKVCRTDAEAYYLARLLPNLPRGTPVCLIGYSLGARAVGGALQLLSGGSMSGRSLAPEVLAAWRNGPSRPIRAMLLAAAMNFDWLEPSCPEGLAPLAVERILVTQNCSDKVLKWYSHLYGRNGPEAMGFVGPSGSADGKLEVVNVACEVGRKHDFNLYQGSAAVSQRLGWYTFLCDSPAGK